MVQSAVPWRVLHLLSRVGKELPLRKVSINQAAIFVSHHLVASQSLTLCIPKCLPLNSSQSVSRNLA